MNLSRLAILRLPVLLAAPLLLAGCISFGEDPPPALLTLTPEAPVSSGSGVTALHRLVSPSKTSLSW